MCLFSLAMRQVLYGSQLLSVEEQHKKHGPAARKTLLVLSCVCRRLGMLAVQSLWLEHGIIILQISASWRSALWLPPLQHDRLKWLPATVWRCQDTHICNQHGNVSSHRDCFLLPTLCISRIILLHNKMDGRFRRFAPQS